MLRSTMIDLIRVSRALWTYGEGFGQGFRSHMSLAISGSDKLRALGVLAVENFLRIDKSTDEIAPSSNSQRWIDAVRKVRGMFGDASHIVHREAPVQWSLFTTEPIETDENILAIIGHCRARWLIEEYFKSIKTGCSFEKRQLESYKTLLVTLAITLPVGKIVPPDPTIRQAMLGIARLGGHMPSNARCFFLFCDTFCALLNRPKKHRLRSCRYLFV